MLAFQNLEIKTTNFEETVLNMVAVEGMTYIDAVLKFCEKYKLEPEYVKNLISEPIKQKLEIEYQELNMLPKSNNEELPFA